MSTGEREIYPCTGRNYVAPVRCTDVAAAVGAVDVDGASHHGDFHFWRAGLILCRFGFSLRKFLVYIRQELLLVLLGILMVTSKGAAGVTGSGFVVPGSTLAATTTVPIEGMAILFGVDRFMSEARAITNFIGNGVATLVIARSEGQFDDSMRLAADAAEKH